MDKFAKKLSVFLCVISISISLFGCNKTNEPEKNYDDFLPVMKIQTQDYKLPTDKVNYIDSKISTDNILAEYYFDNLSAGIRLRGNSTLKFPKKAYRVKFNEKTSLMGEPEYKNWVLLADYLDASLIRNYAAFKFARQMTNLEFSPSYNHVELYINEKYEGVYLLTDQIQEQKTGRVQIETKISETDTEVPFLIEKNYRAKAEHDAEQPDAKFDWFEATETECITPDEKFGIPHYQYTVKYPEDITQTQFDYITNYYKRAEQAVKSGDKQTIEEMVNVKSVFDYYLVNDLFINRDAIWTSQYMYKAKDGKLTFGPVWDFDWSMNTPWTNEPTVEYSDKATENASEDYFTVNECWLKYLLEIPEYAAEYKARFYEAEKILKSIVQELKDYRKMIRPAAYRNIERWYSSYDDGGSASYVAKNKNLFEDQYDYVLAFLNARMKHYENTVKNL